MRFTGAIGEIDFGELPCYLHLQLRLQWELQQCLNVQALSLAILKANGAEDVKGAVSKLAKLVIKNIGITDMLQSFERHWQEHLNETVRGYVSPGTMIKVAEEASKRLT